MRHLLPPIFSAPLFLVAVGCSTPPASSSKANSANLPPADPSDLSNRHRKNDQSSWPAGLVPCPKDAPAGEGCSTGSASPAAPGSGASQPNHGARSHPGEADPTVWKVPVGPDDPMRGVPSALVTVVEFSDFECPFCKREASVMKELLADYPEDVRLVWKDCPLPVHAQAEPAAELARAARASQGDAGFWKAHDALYESQSELGENLFRSIAKDLGLRWE